MEENIEDLLAEEIKSQIKDLKNCTSATEKTSAVNNLATLYRLKIEDSKTEQAQLENDVSRHEQRLKERELSETVKDRYFRTAIAAAEIILPLAFYAVWMNKGFRFEEEGTFTSTTFRSLFNRFRPTKK